MGLTEDQKWQLEVSKLDDSQQKVSNLKNREKKDWRKINSTSGTYRTISESNIHVIGVPKWEEDENNAERTIEIF